MKRTRAATICTLVAVAALAAGALAWASGRSGDLLLFNHSPSMPRGFYARVAEKPARGAVVTVRASEVAADVAAARGARGDYRLLKHVAAATGDEVCADGAELRINGRLVAIRRSAGDVGSPPLWSGCTTLGADTFLLLGVTPDSFDGRYFGPVSGARIEGVWRPLPGP